MTGNPFESLDAAGLADRRGDVEYWLQDERHGGLLSSRLLVKFKRHRVRVAGPGRVM